MEAVVTALTAELSLLQTTLQRNKAQHRRSKFYRALKGGSATLLAKLGPNYLLKLCSSASTASESLGGQKGASDSIPQVGSLDAAVVTIANAAHSLKQAARQLKQEIAAGYFISLCLAWLAMTARILELLRALVTSFLKKRRALAMPERPSELEDGSFLATALEWLLSYGNAPRTSSGKQSMKKKTNAIASDDISMLEESALTSSKEVDSDNRNNDDDDDDDVGEVVAFAPPSSTTTSVARDEMMAAALPVPMAQSGRVFLATDYSDSDESNNDEKLNSSPLQHQGDTSGFGWTLDTGNDDIDLQPASKASSPTVTPGSAPLKSNTAPSTSFLAEDYSDSDDEEVAPKALEVHTAKLHVKQGGNPEQPMKNRPSLLAQDYSDSEDDEKSPSKALGVSLERTQDSKATAIQSFEPQNSMSIPSQKEKFASPSSQTKAGLSTKKKKRKLADVPGTPIGNSRAAKTDASKKKKKASS